jgi:hypothetical protein
MDQMSSMFQSADPLHSDRSPPTLTDEVDRIRQRAVIRVRRLNWVVGGSLLAGVVAAIVVWFLAIPMNRDANHFHASLAIGLATFFVGGMAGRIMIPRPPANCPECGCDWYRQSHNDMDAWLAWRNCPGCGLQLLRDPDRHWQTDNST